ncbi:amino acid ABC transporter substrate-binding protein [Pleurocapsales cyanobacterium LEGE 06147]|nr:amino acid ABC transporter substrate-binding protein [Pleurocapsales cyanobacterium LEGE 06147]
MVNQKYRLKKETLVPIGLVLLILLIFFWLSNRRENNFIPLIGLHNIANKNSTTSNHNEQITKRISLGNAILVTADNTPEKEIATQAFAYGYYSVAVDRFHSSLKINPNDPEALIYANNALAATRGNEIKIGTSIPIGGSLNVAKEILRGVAQAQQEINQQGGIEGRLIQIEIANDDNDPEIAKQIATKFIDDPKILAVIGHNSSDASIAAAPLYQQAGLVMISPTSVARELSGLGNYIFRTTPSTRVIADTLANYAIESARTGKVAICADSQSQASQSFKEEFTLTLLDYGGDVTATACNFADPYFNPSEIVSKAVSDGAKALLLIPDVNKIHQAIEIARANSKRLPLLGNHTMYTFATLQEGQADINGMVLAVPWYPTTTSDFVVHARQLWGSVGSWRTAAAYDATKAAIQGLRTKASRQELRNSLNNAGFSVEGAAETVTFLPSGDRKGRATLVKILPGKNSGTGYDFTAISSLEDSH